jgi:hypothetical protein
MEIVFQSKRSTEPVLSIVLLDWSCRESFHILDYLSSQAVDRDKFEVLWIEYYDRRAEAIETAIKKNRVAERHPPIDKWIVLDMPRNLYYHKHLMYNVGLIASAGKVVTFCDSDAILSKNFVTSILDSFDKDSNIVLHMDQVRIGKKRTILLIILRLRKLLQKEEIMSSMANQQVYGMKRIPFTAEITVLA